jgi:anti-sigma factor RsiW
MWRAFRRSKKDRCSWTRGALSDYVDGRLNPEEGARIGEHLNTCRGCREDLESLRATVALLRSLPEVTPSRSFAVAPVRAMPGRRALPALRFATAAAVLLLVLAFAVDGTGVFERSAPSDLYWGPAAYEADTDHWLVQGESIVITDSENVTVKKTEVNLVVPDGSDNVSAAVDSLASRGLVYATIEADPQGVPQLVLTEGEEGASVQEFAVVATNDKNTSPFVPSGPAETSAIDDIVSSQEGEFLNVVPSNSDNTVLYAFKLESKVPAEAYEVRSDDSGAMAWGDTLGIGGEAQWVQLLEYGLIGLVAVLVAATVALWLRQRRARAAEANKG